MNRDDASNLDNVRDAKAQAAHLREFRRLKSQMYLEKSGIVMHESNLELGTHSLIMEHNPLVSLLSSFYLIFSSLPPDLSGHSASEVHSRHPELVAQSEGG